MNHKQNLFNFGRDMLLSGTAAVVAKTVVAPIERIKLLLQLQATSVQISRDRQYKGIIDCLLRIPREEGLLSFWRGNLPNVYRYFFTQALNFAFKDAYKSHFAPVYDKDSNRKQLWRMFAGNLASGGAAGVTSVCITYPLDFARTRLAADIGSSSARQFQGMTDCIRNIIAKDGIRGLYRGLSLSIPTVLVYRSIYFGSFDTIKTISPGSSRSFVTTWLLAQTCTTVAGLVAYPMDTIRRRLLMQSGRDVHQLHYTSAPDCCKKIYFNEGGLRAFYKGALTNVFRGMGSALVLVFYDQTKRFL